MSTSRAGASSSAADTKRTRRSPLARGFTLVELMVAMVAGLLVALSVVALSREASNTFHEETRIASAEMQLRTAIDRLRNDVSRASFMSTGNIFIDPAIYNPTLASPVASNVAAGTCTGTTAMCLYSLAGIRLWPGGSVTAATPLSGVNNLSPDAIDIAGNMTGAEILSVGGAPPGQLSVQNGVGCGGQGQRVFLNLQGCPALWRLVGMSPTGTDTAYGAQLKAAFQPVDGMSFIVRYQDDMGKTQYAPTCATTSGDFSASGSEPVAWNGGNPYIDLASNALTVFGTNQLASINPVQIVHWQIGASQVNPLTGVTADKYDLTRQYVDMTGTPITSTPPEVVAEYAVDLKFAFTVDNLPDLTGDYSAAGGSTLVVNAFEDSANGVITNAVAAGSVTASAVPYAGGTEPQRIRSVRIRLVTRTPTADRSEPLAVSGAANDYLYRYCVLTAGCTAGAPNYARTRTLISEVALPNQARFWFR